MTAIISRPPFGRASMQTGRLYAHGPTGCGAMLVTT